MNFWYELSPATCLEKGLGSSQAARTSQGPTLLTLEILSRQRATNAQPEASTFQRSLAMSSLHIIYMMIYMIYIYDVTYVNVEELIRVLLEKLEPPFEKVD